MGQGTTRVIESNGADGRVRELGDEISDVRRQLDSLVMELDRRRHRAADWRGHLRRNAGSIAVGALVIAVAVTGPVLLARFRTRRRSRLAIRGAQLAFRGGELTKRARALGRAFERVVQNPDRVAPTTAKTATLSVGSRTAVAVSTMIAQLVARQLVNRMAKPRALSCR